MPKRLQSPSSINLYLQCPRKYYYQYIAKLPTKDSIHLLRGSIAHTTLERFFDIDVSHLDEENYLEEMSFYLKNLFQACWNKEKSKLLKLGLTEKELLFYYEETIMMLANWLQQFVQDLEKKAEQKGLQDAFDELKPVEIEEHYKSQDLMVRGYIDYIQKVDGEVKVMDYKTSKKFKITDAYQLQLGIYALLYKEKYGELPDKVGIWFLKHEELSLPATEDMALEAQFQVEQVHAATENAEEIHEYPMKPSPLCKWSTGQCDFYDLCFQNMTQSQYKELHFRGKK